MIKEKTLTIELSHENPLGDGYFYAMLDLPAEEHEIRDAEYLSLRRPLDRLTSQTALKERCPRQR